MDNQPVVAIVGQQARTALGAHYQQEVDLVNLFKDVASDYVAIGTVPSQVRHMVDRAVRIAQYKRSVTCIILPNDLQLMKYEDPPMAHGSTHTGVGYPVESRVPAIEGLQAAARVLNEGQKIAMLVGAGCLDATDEVSQWRIGSVPDWQKRFSEKPRFQMTCHSLRAALGSWAPNPRGTLCRSVTRY